MARKKTNNINLKEFHNIDDLRKQLFLLPTEVGELLRIGDNSLYKLLSDINCPFPVIRLSTQIIRIPSKQFFQWYDNAAI